MRRSGAASDVLQTIAHHPRFTNFRQKDPNTGLMVLDLMKELRWNEGYFIVKEAMARKHQCEGIIFEDEAVDLTKLTESGEFIF